MCPPNHRLQYKHTDDHCTCRERSSGDYRTRHYNRINNPCLHCSNYFQALNHRTGNHFRTGLNSSL